MKMEWENELNQDIPNLDERMITNTQQIRTKIQALKSTKKSKRSWLFGGAAASLAIAVSIFAVQTNPWGSENANDLQASSQSPSQLSGILKSSVTEQEEYLRNYGDLINQHFPKLKVVLSKPSPVVKDQSYRDSRDSMLDVQQPDLIMISSDFEYTHLIREGKLLNLDKYIKGDQFDLKNIIPTSIQTLKNGGNGSIYGLSPTFNNSAMVYNKAIFDQYHIAYPTDQMSWEEILKLADQFPKSGKEDARIYGFHEKFMTQYSPVYLINMIANTNGLQYMNEQATQVAMGSQAWNQTFHLALESYQSGILHKPAATEIVNNQILPYKQQPLDLFVQGKAAMALVKTETYIRYITKSITFKTGIITAPVSKAQPNTTSFFNNLPIFAINAKAANPDAAWEVIKYINSEAVAKLKAQTTSGLTTHLSVLQGLEYNGLNAFYKLDKARSTLYEFPDLAKNDFSLNFDVIIEEEVAKVMNGKQTIDEAQKNIQKREQSNMDKSNSE